MRLIVLTGLPVLEKALLTQDLARYYLAQGQRVAVLDNANLSEQFAALEQVTLVTMRGGCACCSVAGKLFQSVAQLGDKIDVAIMAANNQTHVDSLSAVLESLVSGNPTPITVQRVALVDERTECCFPYVAQTLEENTDITLSAPFSLSVALAALEYTPQL